jgi:hypothetical protein
VAALIKKETGVDTELVEGGRGEFTVWVGEEVVARKDSFGFPEENEALAAVRQALARG